MCVVNAILMCFYGSGFVERFEKKKIIIDFVTNFMFIENY